MLEVSCFPAERSWQANAEHPYYFEVFGETNPKVDMKYAEVQPASKGKGAADDDDAAPIYEYWWTIGHGGRHTSHHLLPFVKADDGADPDAVWDELEDLAARVYLFFPTWHGWRIKELSAQMKYLSPVRQSTSLVTALAQDWKDISPLVSGAGALAGAVAPLAGGAVKGASTALDTLAKLQINSVPPSGEYKWSAIKVTCAEAEGVLQGVGWELPAKMLTDLGGRLTGSLALSFIPARYQAASGASKDPAALTAGKLRAHAVVYAKGGREFWAPAKGEFMDLELWPTAEDTATGSPPTPAHPNG